MATDPALIGWQRLGGSPSAGKSIIQVCTSTVHRRVGLPPEREAAGRKTSSSNTEPVLETAHEDAERDDEHLVGNAAKLTRLLKASTDTLSLMA